MPSQFVSVLQLLYWLNASILGCERRPQRNGAEPAPARAGRLAGLDFTQSKLRLQFESD